MTDGEKSDSPREMAHFGQWLGVCRIAGSLFSHLPPQNPANENNGLDHIWVEI